VYALKGKYKTDYNDESTVTNDESSDNVDEHGIYIDLPFLAQGFYDWYALLDLNRVRNPQQSFLKLPHDFLPLQKKFTNNDAIKNCNFFKMEPSQKNIEKCLSRMNNIRTTIRKTIQTVIYKYWIDVANQLQMKIPNEERALRKIDCVMQSIASIETYEDAKKVTLSFLH
jgi:hypothetical protein